MIVLLVMAAVVVAAPVGAAVLVTVASHREDAARSIAGRPPGPFAALARAVVCLRIGGTVYPRRRRRHYPHAPRPSAESELGRTRALTLPRV
ncbi:MAG TPA: hypothetical protein VMB74_06285 [Streptosporangiaceae bacterium]|nr:hypothetical protein [Streptosporangiaceae bacterium]